jgi:hypothetical protein
LRERSPSGARNVAASIRDAVAQLGGHPFSEPTTRKCECRSSSATLKKPFIAYARQSKSCIFAIRRWSADQVNARNELQDELCDAYWYADLLDDEVLKVRIQLWCRDIWAELEALE